MVDGIRASGVALLARSGPRRPRGIGARADRVERFDAAAERPRAGAATRESGAFFDVAGRRSAAFGYENRALEAWAYPLKLVDDFQLSFRLEGYPLEFEGPEIAAVWITVRPEATIFTYSHAGLHRAPDALRAGGRAGRRDAARRRAARCP